MVGKKPPRAFASHIHKRAIIGEGDMATFKKGGEKDQVEKVVLRTVVCVWWIWISII